MSRSRRRTAFALLFTLVTLPVTVACGRVEDPQPEPEMEPLSEVREPASRLGPRFEVDWLLGKTEAGQEALLGRPTDVRVDSEGRVYVVDMASMKIKIYGTDGTVLGELGGRGRERDQFLRIHAFHVDRRDRVVVADGSARRLVVMDRSGEILFEREMNLEEMLWPREIQQLQDGRFLFIYKMPKTRQDGSAWPKSEYFLHLYDEELTQKLAAFAPVEDFGPIDHFLNDSYSQTRPGSFWPLQDGSVIFAPGLYRGQIHRYAETASGEWEKVATWQGYVAQDPPLVEVNANIIHRYMNFQVTQAGSKRAARIRNESRGIFALADGRVAHFSVFTAGTEHMEVMWGVEIFSADGKLEGYGVVPSTTDHHHTEQFYVDWKDDQDRFYVREATDRFVVWIARLELGQAPDGPIWGITPPDAASHGHPMDHS